MDKRGKDVWLIVLIIVALVSVTFAINAAMTSTKNKKSFEKEMAFRLDMEEKVNVLRNEKVELLNALKNKDVELKKQNELTDSLQQTIAKLDGEYTQLKEQLQKTEILKQQLESDLKNAAAGIVAQPKTQSN